MVNSSSNAADTRPRSIKQLRSSDGFTLIELLVVILIIGVLAAIAVPSFLAQRSKGQDSCAKSMSRAMQTAMEAYATDNDGRYTSASISDLNTIESSITDNKCGGTTGLVVGRSATGGACDATAPSNNSYCVHASSVTGNVYAIARSSSGRVTRVCTRTDVQGGCGGSGASGTW